MLPIIMMALQAAQKKGQAENQDLQNQANALRNTPIQMQQQQPQMQLPSINSVFGNY